MDIDWEEMGIYDMRRAIGLTCVEGYNGRMWIFFSSFLYIDFGNFGFSA